MLHGVGRALGDRPRTPRTHGRRVFQVADLDGVQPPAAFHHGAIAEPACDRFRGQRGRHDHDFQVRPDGLLHAADHGQGQVAVEVPLVELVEHDRGDRSQEGVVLQHAEEDAFGDDPDPRLRAQAAIEADVVADLAAQRRAALESDPPRTGPGRQAAGLQDDDRAVAGQPRIEHGRRHAGRLARAGGGPQDHGPRNSQGGHDLRQDFVDRQGGGHRSNHPPRSRARIAFNRSISSFSNPRSTGR